MPPFIFSSEDGLVDGAGVVGAMEESMDFFGDGIGVESGCWEWLLGVVVQVLPLFQLRQTSLSRGGSLYQEYQVYQVFHLCQTSLSRGGSLYQKYQVFHLYQTGLSREGLLYQEYQVCQMLYFRVGMRY